MSGFNDIIGQDLIKDHLKSSIASGQIAHAYIINGERGSGKEFIARVFAQTIQCEAVIKDSNIAEPCEECHACKQSISGNNPDIIRITHEKPNTISVDDIRTQINADVQIKPYGNGKKIYIINDAQKMNEQAQNALLKTLEEPPEYVVIILLTSNAEMLLQTIRSRCIMLNMKPVENKLMRKYLMESLAITDYRADVCIAFARGNIGRAKMLATSEDFENIKEEAIALVKNIRDMDMDGLIKAVKRFNDFKMDMDDVFDILIIWYRDILLYKATREVGDLTFKDELKYIKKQAEESEYEGIERVIKSIDTAKIRLNANVNFDLTLELLLLTIRENS